MASLVLPLFKQHLGTDKLIDIDGDTWKFAMVSDAYTAGDYQLSDYTVVGTAQTVAGVSFTNGAFATTTTTTTFTSVATGSTVVGFIYYDDTTATKWVAAFIDVTDFPTNGGNVAFTHASPVFSL